MLVEDHLQVRYHQYQNQRTITNLCKQVSSIKKRFKMTRSTKNSLIPSEQKLSCTAQQHDTNVTQWVTLPFAKTKA